MQLWHPATADVEEGVHTGHVEADDEDVRVVVAQRAESVIRLLQQEKKKFLKSEHTSTLINEDELGR